VTANQYGRSAALALLALFGLALLFPGLADRLTRPLVALGARLSEALQQIIETTNLHGAANACELSSKQWIQKATIAPLAVVVRVSCDDPNPLDLLM
jgi:hypothetical protein